MKIYERFQLTVFGQFMANFLPKYGLKSLIFAHEIFRRLTFLARPEGLSAITISRSKKKTSLEIHFIHEFRDFSSFLFIFYKKRNQNISVFITSWGPLTAKFKGKCPISRNFHSVCDLLKWRFIQEIELSRKIQFRPHEIETVLWMWFLRENEAEKRNIWGFFFSIIMCMNISSSNSDSSF